ncbi:MAG: aminotransferase class I/II-fold pyridoxal phosphate-dependent enzyme [Proteobacteria bacterium]|nr:aminotransferase class I/II-fold pyridoxal phosphate-dependent enzyme [Pseudomonadota bacterium]
MNMVAARIARVNASASEQASGRARELIAAGADVISLASGEPDFDTPPHVIEAAIAAMRAGETRYTGTGGTPELRSAIIEKFRRDNCLSFGKDEIIASAGLKNVIYLALTASLNPGDEVIVPAPHWVSYTDMTVLAGGTPVVVGCGENTGFKLQPDALRAAITDKTRWLMLNAPNNPTGTIYSKEELAALADVIRGHAHVMVMVDEIYEHILFDGRKFHSLAAVAPDIAPRILTLNGVSKAYAMTGWRVGFAGGAAPLIAAMKKVQSQTLGSICSISQAASIAALTGPQDYLADRSASFESRRNATIELLDRVPGLRCHRPEGAFYLFVHCGGLIGAKTNNERVLHSDADVATFLLDQAQVVVVAGAAYGLSPYIRLSIATSLDKLRLACDRVAKAVATLQ